MASSSSPPGAGDDLDQLLDSALDDFTSLDLHANSQSGGEEASASASAERKPVQGLGLGLGMGMGLPDPRAPRRRAGREPALPARGRSASEALEQLTRETREALRGLETATSSATAGGSGGGGGGSGGLDEEAMVEEFVKQFEDLAGSEDMESFVSTMMQQLMSKEILHEPMMEIVQRYPKWLEENKDKLSKEEFERYNNQLELMLKLNVVYENEPENFSKIADVMQKMQEYGQPPSDILKEFVPDVDLSNLGQLSPEMLEGAPNCCIM